MAPAGGPARHAWFPPPPHHRRRPRVE